MLKYMSSVGSLFPLEDHKETSHCGAVLAWGMGHVVLRVAAPPHLSAVVCLGLCDVGGTSAALSCSSIFSVVSCP